MPFSAARRPIHSSSGAPGSGVLGGAKNVPSTPQRTTTTFGQSAAFVNRQIWVRPYSLMATTKRARATFSRRWMPPLRSNSSGPWTVMLNGGPPSSWHSIATNAELVPKCACSSCTRLPMRRASAAASTRYAKCTNSPRSERLPRRSANHAARQPRSGCRQSVTSACHRSAERLPASSTSVRARSARSSSLSMTAAAGRTAKRCTLQPSRSSAWISRRMNV
jgi:hypothetical protein